MFSLVHRRFFHSSSPLLKKKRIAEQRWLARQSNDPYVKASHALNFRCRSAFKLLEVDDKFRLLQPGCGVVDCGAAPGAWSQVAVHRVNSAGTDSTLPRGTVVGIDLLNIPSLDGAHFLSCHDVTDPATHAKVTDLLPGGRAHVLLSDMAPNASGFRELDHEKLIGLCLSLSDLAEKILRPGGSLLCKYWDGALASHLQHKLCLVFGSVQSLKPHASRKDSAERYFLARNYKIHVKG
ncbi:rRNA methyltransferase 2, mitochondrial [Syngnathoides biaculeatus]|uniref:rRNA methyltransferase 2, mitochondrial n=1 Tax=Syngnathoides biaculeatus TaxID=300417 RepID=UPI002ADD5B5D|nr:rRNA methyltransferase 2, mitochondrial [Syngnathoides biaculeatus]